MNTQVASCTFFRRRRVNVTCSRISYHSSSGLKRDPIKAEPTRSLASKYPQINIQNINGPVHNSTSQAIRLERRKSSVQCAGEGRGRGCQPDSMKSLRCGPFHQEFTSSRLTKRVAWRVFGAEDAWQGTLPAGSPRATALKPSFTKHECLATPGVCEFRCNWIFLMIPVQVDPERTLEIE